MATSPKAFVLALLLAGGPARADFRLEPPIDFTTTLKAPRAVALADVSMDSLLDAVVVGATEAMYACYRGAGDGSFADTISSGSLYLSPSDLVVADFNRDGILDIAGINSACLS